MIVSNEPGYYKTGAYGIRIENLVAVRVETEQAENGKRWLGFETITRAPLDQRLIDLTLLTPQEVGWIDAYHALVWRSEEHTSELQSLMRISYAVFCLKKKTHHHQPITKTPQQLHINSN